MGPDAPRELRASDADREAAVGRLRIAAMEGRLDADELATRVSTAYDAKYCSELERLTYDVTPAAVPQTASAPVFVQPSRTTNGWAVASLVMAFVWFLWIGSAAAVLAGHIALRQISASHGRQSGRGLAIAGLAVGYFGLASLFTVIVAAIFSS